MPNLLAITHHNACKYFKHSSTVRNRHRWNDPNERPPCLFTALTNQQYVQDEQGSKNNKRQPRRWKPGHRANPPPNDTYARQYACSEQN